MHPLPPKEKSMLNQDGENEKEKLERWKEKGKAGRGEKKENIRGKI